MAENKEVRIIDMRKIAKTLLENRRIFYKTLPVVFIVSCLLIISVPRYYISEVKLAPEMELSAGGGTIGTIASSFGFNLSDMQTMDAISPLLYPDLMEDNSFVTDLFSIKVRTEDGTIETDYYTYLKKYQSTAWWNYPLRWVKRLFKEKSKKGNGDGTFDPYNIGKDVNDVAEAIRGNVLLNVDKKTTVLTISVTAQDPMVCKIMADSLRVKLQDFITAYRTNKACVDVTYYEGLVADAKKEYEDIRASYIQFTDANQDVLLESVRAKQEDLENEMQLKYNTYSTLCTQLQAAKAKVQERTPVFTVIKGAAVPVKPAGPKRMIFVLGMMFLSCIGISLWLCRGQLLGRAE